MLHLLKKSMWIILGTVMVLLLIAIVKTYTLPSRQIVVKDTTNATGSLSSEAVRRLSEAIRIRTVTPADPDRIDTLSFLRLHQFIRNNYPLVHQHLSLDKVAGLSLLYTWQGKDSLAKPFLLMAHQDVVPADDSLAWTLPPFSGQVQHGYIYGRGTLDIKSGMIGLLEAAEALLREGFTPERTLYLAFGHDEESGRGTGAKAIAGLLLQRQVKLDFVLDEGGLILKNALPGLNHPVALVGIAEKGFVNIRITAQGQGGHSSMPFGETAITRLASAIRKINDHPLPASLQGPFVQLLDYTTPEMKFPFNVLFSNRWLFSSLILSQMEKAPSSNAAVRTTVAVTMLQGSTKENVIPAEASAIVNLRLLPGTTPEGIAREFDKIIGDTMVHVRILSPYQLPSTISDTSSVSFKHIQRTIATMYPNVLTAPFLMVAFTDSRNYASVAENIYRFHPAFYDKSDLSRLHGRDERLALADYRKIIAFYRTLIVKSF